MTGSSTINSVASVGGGNTRDLEAIWPLKFALQPAKDNGTSLQAYGFSTDGRQPKRFWSHELYRDSAGKSVQILYSKTKSDSENLARQFLNERIVGFDMEWPWNDHKFNNLQNKVGLIQVASEDKIALFHIGLHEGRTTNDLIAPSLKWLIETPTIGKIGVSVAQADFGRLRRWFGLKPQGAIEISHLYRLVKYGGWKPELVSCKAVGLAKQVEDQFKLELHKGAVRTSNWSKALSREQIKYAAADAYAGYMLFRYLNYKRMQMKRVPPLPIYVERYPRGKSSKDDPLILDTGADTIPADEFFGTTSAQAPRSASKVAKSTGPKVPLDVISQALYTDLEARRAQLAEQGSIRAFRIISDNLLQAIARERPTDTDSLLSIKGIGVFQQNKYGGDWIEVVHNFLAANGLPVTNCIKEGAAMEPLGKDIAYTPATSRSSRTRSQAPNVQPRSRDSSPAFATPPRRLPQLHTGLSFTMAETSLGGDADDDFSWDSDATLPSLDFGVLDAPAGTTSSLKRKRAGIDQDDRTVADATETEDDTGESPHLQMQPLSPASKIARSKVLALSRQIARKVPGRSIGAPALVTDRTLDLIVQRAPRTEDELERVPGIDSLLLACEQTQTNLLERIIKFVPPRA